MQTDSLPHFWQFSQSCFPGLFPPGQHQFGYPSKVVLATTFLTFLWENQICTYCILVYHNSLLSILGSLYSTMVWHDRYQGYDSNYGRQLTQDNQMGEGNVGGAEKENNIKYVIKNTLALINNIITSFISYTF